MQKNRFRNVCHTFTHFLLQTLIYTTSVVSETKIYFCGYIGWVKWKFWDFQMSSELFHNIITQPCPLLLIGIEDQSKLKLVGSVKSWLWRNFYEAIRFIVPIHLVRMMLEEAWTKDAPLQLWYSYRTGGKSTHLRGVGHCTVINKYLRTFQGRQDTSIVKSKIMIIIFVYYLKTIDNSVSK